MKKNTYAGLIIGIIAGIIDVIPMIIQKLPINADLSAFTMWIVIGYLLSITTLKIHGALRGLFLSFLVLFPNLFIISWDDPFKLVPIVVMTGILGAIAGYVYQKIVR